MTNGTVSSTIDSKYQRAQCPVCNVICEQRRRAVLCDDGTNRPALDCVECEAIYLVGEPAAVTTAKEP